MMNTHDSNELINAIAEKSGVMSHADLKFAHSFESLFSILEKIDKSKFTIEEWKSAMAYLFDLNPIVPPSSQKCREIILWNTGQWGQYIAEIMENYFTAHGMTGSFYYITGNYGPRLSPEKQYLIFYHSSCLNRAEAINFINGDCSNVSFAAICDDYNDGIQSMDKGDCYALKLPLEEDKVIRCYEHFNTDHEKESFI